MFETINLTKKIELDLIFFLGWYDVVSDSPKCVNFTEIRLFPGRIVEPLRYHSRFNCLHSYPCWLTAAADDTLRPTVPYHPLYKIINDLFLDGFFVSA